MMILDVVMLSCAHAQAQSAPFHLGVILAPSGRRVTWRCSSTAGRLPRHHFARDSCSRLLCLRDWQKSSDLVSCLTPI